MTLTSTPWIWWCCVPSVSWWESSLSVGRKTNTIRIIFSGASVAKMLEDWMKVSLLLCVFGFFREIRPIEPFTIEYFIREKNITRYEITRYLYPWGTYAYLLQIIVVFLVTDALRWVDKPFHTLPEIHSEYFPDTSQWYYFRHWVAARYSLWWPGPAASPACSSLKCSTARTWQPKSPTSHTSMQKLNAANINSSQGKRVQPNWWAAFWVALYHRCWSRSSWWASSLWLYSPLAVSKTIRNDRQKFQNRISRPQSSVLQWCGRFCCQPSAAVYISIARNLRLTKRKLRPASALWNSLSKSWIASRPLVRKNFNRRTLRNVPSRWHLLNCHHSFGRRTRIDP